MLSRLLRAGEGRTLRHLARVAQEVGSRAEEYAAYTDAELRAQTDAFRARLQDGAHPDELLVEAFAVAREASHRVLGQRHFDVQVMGGVALHLGSVAEMRTGEGKTLTCVLPAYLNALAGKGVHVVTVNDYLAQRDAEMMGRVHSFLGLQVGTLLSSDSSREHRAAYVCDITYGTNNTFGFDYLRDNMAWGAQELVQRGHHFAIVDEVDSILIDEARTPLVISGPAEMAEGWYAEFSRIARVLQRGRHYEVDEMKRTVGVNEEGVELVEDQLGIDNLYEPANTPLVGHLNNALRAKELYRRDKEYVVTGGEVHIVDSFTGRVLAGRRYSDGMHQALEAKEGVEIQNENQTLAMITLQNYFRLYDKLAGMTGTAMTEAAELHQTYGLNVVPIPTNQSMIRRDLGDTVYLAEEAKFKAVVEDIVSRHEKGQPVLVGTTSVERSETLSELLRIQGVPHEVLNAKQHEREAHIIAQAGRKGAVTVATNMAGRGTDIMLGGNAEFIAEDTLRAHGLQPGSPEWEAQWETALGQAREQVHAEHDEVRGLGGLYVIGTERHEARRIDNQLRGRSGRQGDPGVSKFYLSLGDELMRRFNSSATAVLDRLNLPPDLPIESKMMTRSIQSAQAQVEAQNFEMRKNVLKYDEVLNRQRTVVYEERRKVLEGENLSPHTRGMLEDVITEYILAATSTGYPDEWDLDSLQHALEELYPCAVQITELSSDPSHLSAEILLREVSRDAQEAYDRRELELGSGESGEPRMRALEREVLLYVLDQKWREHLYEMDYLQEGIGLRAMGQRDPLVEYQREAFDMFEQMLAGLKEEVATLLFRTQQSTHDPAEGETPEAEAAEGAAPGEAQAAAEEPAPPGEEAAAPESAESAPPSEEAPAPATEDPEPLAAAEQQRQS